MDCDTCREGISARLDGETTPAEDAAVAEHVAHCAPCRRFADRLDRFDRGLRGPTSGPAGGPAGGPTSSPAVSAVDHPETSGTSRGVTDPTDALVARLLAPAVAAGEHLAPVVATVVPADVCGCHAGCGCGCRDGRACRCGHGCAHGAA